MDEQVSAFNRTSCLLTCQYKPFQQRAYLELFRVVQGVWESHRYPFGAVELLSFSNITLAVWEAVALSNKQNRDRTKITSLYLSQGVSRNDNRNLH